MNSSRLTKVDFSSDRPLVSARDLHAFLEVETPYRKWFPRMCEYGFTEGADFNPDKNVRVQREGNRDVTREIDDAALTIDMAKEICMLQRNEKGKQARQYFLQLEKDWNSPEKVMARALRIADAKISDLTKRNRALAERNRALTETANNLKAAADYCDRVLTSPGSLTITQIAADYGLSAKRLNEILHEEKVQRKVNGQWILYAEYMGYNLTESVTVPVVGKDGKRGVRMSTRWTQSGRIWIDYILSRRGIFTRQRSDTMARAMAILLGETPEESASD